MKKTGKDIDRYISIKETKYKIAIIAEIASITLAAVSIIVCVANKEDLDFSPLN